MIRVEMQRPYICRHTVRTSPVSDQKELSKEQDKDNGGDRQENGVKHGALSVLQRSIERLYDPAFARLLLWLF